MGKAAVWFYFFSSSQAPLVVVLAHNASHCHHSRSTARDFGVIFTQRLQLIGCAIAIKIGESKSTVFLDHQSRQSRVPSPLRSNSHRD